MSWNYRVIYHPPHVRTMSNNKKIKVGGWYAIHEVYYDKKGKITAYSVGAEGCASDANGFSKQKQKEAKKELGEILKMIESALEKPFLNEKDLEKPKKKIDKKNEK